MISTFKHALHLRHHSPFGQKFETPADTTLSQAETQVRLETLAMGKSCTKRHLIHCYVEWLQRWIFFIINSSGVATQIQSEFDKALVTCSRGGGTQVLQVLPH